MKTNTQLDINQVWELFHKTHDDLYRNLLMEHYWNLVRHAAERLHRNLPDNVQLDDLSSAGQFGLMDAIDAYDPGRGAKFETYCAQRVRGAMLDELRSMDWVPRLVRAHTHQLSKAANALRSHLGREPLAKEMADELKISIVEFSRRQRKAKAVGLISLTAKSGDGEGDNEICEIDVIPDRKSKNPMIEAQKRDLKHLLTKGMSRAECLIVVLYYFEEMTMKEIGATLDLSESRVSQMHSLILARLKAQMSTRQHELSMT